uniref:Uncharacterized protein n=1 Tax=Cannabis sativa TaxID=3483 RepID=A0A803P1Z0_CANSA
MDNFSNFIHKFHLSPLPFEGNKFTWHNHSVKEHIDWVVSSASWSDLFPNASLHHLFFFGSDHRALKLILNNNGLNSHSRNGKRFHFENVWLENPDFFSVVQTAWDSGLSNQNALTPFHSFLSTQDLCISALKSWNKVSNYSIKSRISDLQKEIACLQDISIVDHESRFRVKCLQSELDALLYKEEVYWNSDGSDADAISLILDCLGPPLEEWDYAFLDEPFLLKEVRKALFNLSGDKAPGLDGLNAYFYQKNWSTLGVDFAKAVLSCLNNEGWIFYIC